MDDGKVQAALAALDDLARAELSATQPGRHGRAIRVLNLAEQLARMHARRVADVVDHELGQSDGDLALGHAVGVRRMRNFNSPAEDLVRGLLDAVPQLVAAQRGDTPARQLGALLDLRDRLTRPEDAGLRAQVQAEVARLGAAVAAPPPVPAPVAVLRAADDDDDDVGEDEVEGAMIGTLEDVDAAGIG